MYEDLLYGFYSLRFKFSGKFFPVILILLFFSSILYLTTNLFLSGANKKWCKRKNSVGRKCCQLKVLKVLLMHLFVTLLINKTTVSDNRHFFFNTMKNENKEEYLRYITLLFALLSNSDGLSAWFFILVSNDAWNIFQNRGIHFIHFNIASCLRWNTLYC